MMNRQILNGLVSTLLPIAGYASGYLRAAGYQNSSARLWSPDTASRMINTERSQSEPLANMTDQALAIQTGQSIQELVIIDEAVPDKALLYRSLKPGAIAVEIPSGSDGLRQLKHMLSQYQNLAAVHLVSHADDGEIVLGNRRIYAEEFKKDTALFNQLNSTIRVGGDLLLYGCELAATEKGEALLDIIAGHTHVDVAASNDLTGARALGADWDLEITRGEIDTDLAFSEKALKDFSHVLTPYASGQFCAGTDCTSASITSDDGYLTVTASAGTVYVENSGSHDYITDYDATGTTGWLDFAAAGTKASFQLGGLSLKTYNGHYCDISVTGYYDGGSKTTPSEYIDDSFELSHNVSALSGLNLTHAKVNFTGCDFANITVLKTLDAINFIDIPVNNAPTDITLDTSTINQSATGSGSIVGGLTTTDADGGDTHTYALVNNGASDNGSCGASGGDDNASFQVDSANDDLETSGSITAGSYNVCIETDDSTDSFQKTFSITVTDDMAPTFDVTPTVTGTTYTGATVNADLNEEGTVYYVVVADGAGAPSVAQVKNGQNSSGGGALASGSFVTSSTTGSDAFSGLTLDTNYDLYVVAQDDEGTPNVQSSVTLVNFTTAPPNADGTLTASGAVTEPVGLDTTVDTTGEAVNVFDFTLTDGGTGDAQSMDISQIVLNVTGTATDTVRNQITWRLNGNDASNVVGVYNAGADTLTFSGLSLSIADGTSETYTVNAWYNDNTNLTEGQTIILSVDGDTDVTVSGSGTTMAATSAVTNSTGTTIDVTATQLAFTTQPAGSVSGSALSTQPVVTARDAFANTDVDFTGNVTVTESSSGSLSGTATLAASVGIAAFTNVAYTASADQESFSLTASATGLTDATSNSVTSDVVATVLNFSTEPAPTSMTTAEAMAFTTVPVVRIEDADGTLDTGYSTDIALSVTDPNDGVIDGTVNSLTGTGDNDGSSATVTLTPSSGVATFTGLNLTYTAGGATDSIAFLAQSGALTDGTSATISVGTPPVVSDGYIDISGASGTGGAFIIGDTVTATWNDTGSGDNNGNISGVTIDFSAFGGGSAVVAANSSNTWTATYTLTAGAIDSTHRNVSVTATNTDNIEATTADTTNATVDNIDPSVTDSHLSISGASGTSGAYIIGDTVTATWNDTGSGDNNSDTIASATVNFSAFGGGNTVSASQSSGTWTATYTLTSGAIDSTHRNVSIIATDNAGNTATVTDSTNAAVDNIAPVLTDANIAISGATGNGGEFIMGDTVTATWDNTGSGDNNTDTISAVAVDFSAFGGGASVSATNSSDRWSATCTVTAGTLEASNLNVAVTITDNAGNEVNTADTTNASVDNQAPNGHSVSFDDTVINATERTNQSFTFAGGQAGDAYSYTISSDGGGTNVTGAGTLTTATDQINSLDVSSLNDGTLTLSVIVTDPAGNSATAVTDTAALDTAAPSGHTVSFDDTAINATEASAASFTFAGAEIGLDYSYTISSDGGGTSVTGSGTLTTATDQITGIDLGGLNEGTLTLSVTLTDAAGNASTAVTANATLDTTAPIGQSVSMDDAVYNASEASTASFTFAGGEVGAHYAYTLSSDGGGTSVTDSGTLTTATDQITGIDLSGLNDGTLTLSVTLTDAAGNSATAVTATATLETAAPSGHTVSFDDTTINATEASATSFTFAGAEIGLDYSYTISSDGGGTSVTDSGTLTTATDQITGIDLSGLNEGTLTLSVTLTDAAGNTATAVTANATLDTTAPIGQSVSMDDAVYNASEASTASFTFAGGEVGAHYAYTLSSDGGATSVTGSGTLTTATDQITGIDLSGLNDGTLTLSVTLTDAAGNASTAVTANATLDTTAPIGQSVSMDDAVYNASEASTASFTFAGGEVGAHYAYTLSSDGGGTSVTDSGILTTATDQITGIDLSGLNDGTLTLSVILTDAAGSAATAVTDTAVLDTTAPSVAANTGLSVEIGLSGTLTATELEYTDATSAASTVTFTLATAPGNGTLKLNGIALSATDTFTQTDINSSLLTYTHDGGTSTGDNFGVSVSDAAGNRVTGQSVSITITDSNTPPTISGTPATTVEVGQAYSFTPTANDDDTGDTLTFSMTSQPAWASFSTTTGALTGTPASGDEGLYAGIVISVSDGADSASLNSFAIEVSDATDTDGDHVPDYQEVIDGTDPNDPTDYLDTTPPVVTAPADQVFDAIALFTPITLRQLLGMEMGSTEADINNILENLAVDNIDGDACCSPQIDSPLNRLVLLPPGKNEVIWQATDAKGNVGKATQMVRIRPLVSLSKHKITAEGATAHIKVLLNGQAPDTPFSVPLVIDTDHSTVDSSDHDFTDTTVVFSEGETEKTISIAITDDATTEGIETLVLKLDDRTTNSDDLSGGYDPNNIDIYDINTGAKTALRITIMETNVAPNVTLRLQQNGTDTILIAPDGGTVRVTTTVIDANTGDTFTYDWRATDSELVDTNADDAVFEFDPSALPAGRYKMQLTVTDSGGADDTARLRFRVVNALPALGTEDSDNDGIDDTTEGTADSDDDGILDYLDNISATNVLPEVASETDAYLVECDPGVLCRLGQFALMGSNGGVRLSDEDLTGQNDLTADDAFEFHGGVFDFEIHDLPTLGQSVRVVLPLNAAIPESGVYRKFQNGQWSDFVEDANNQIHSAEGNLGYCPPPGDDSWESGLRPGYYCVQLTIEDGGANDADGIVNATVEDPGAVARATSATVTGLGKTGVISIGLLVLSSLMLLIRKRKE